VPVQYTMKKVLALWGQAWAEALVFNQKYNTDKELRM